MPLNDDGSLVRLVDARVAYTDNVVFKDLNWTIRPGEHWQVKGPNGSGKTCLLGLVTGDHPQCYVNDLRLFGRQRGQGETIWQLKTHMGFVSTSLHWDYRLSVGVRNGDCFRFLRFHWPVQQKAAERHTLEIGMMPG